MREYDYIMETGFVRLNVYKRAQALYPRVIAYGKSFPPHGYHLRDQLCRAANSVQANIAEGYGRSVAEFKMYLTRSLGSCNEVMSHITDAVNVPFGDSEEGSDLLREYDIVGKQLYRLREKWK